MTDKTDSDILTEEWDDWDEVRNLFPKGTEGVIMPTLKEVIESCMGDENETFDDVVCCLISEETLKKDINIKEMIEKFGVWTKNRFYTGYIDGKCEGVMSIPRNPCNDPKIHFALIRL